MIGEERNKIGRSWIKTKKERWKRLRMKEKVKPFKKEKR